MQIQTILKNFGLKDKDIAVYLSLVELGPSPVRSLATKSGVNRGTTYDILKSLIALGLVSYYQKSSHQYFTAEPPEKLLYALDEKEKELKSVKQQIEKSLPELQTLFQKQGGRPTMKIFEGQSGIRQILIDVLTTMSEGKDKTYYVYSSATVRKNVYESMPDFTSKRIAKKISVKTIALGKGGQLIGLDERKWMESKQNLKATYEIIYGGKIAHISVDQKDSLVGIVIENSEIYETQKLIFEFNWQNLS